MQGDLILLERKTSRGRIGSIGPDGIEWTPDVGRRREEGHVLVKQIAPELFTVGRLLDYLKAADTWKQPGWIEKMEREERLAKEHRKSSREADMRYRASQVFDRFVWTNKQRVFGGI
jgi:hypothetical protein